MQCYVVPGQKAAASRRQHGQLLKANGRGDSGKLVDKAGSSHQLRSDGHYGLTKSTTATPPRIGRPARNGATSAHNVNNGGSSSASNSGSASHTPLGREESDNSSDAELPGPTKGKAKVTVDGDGAPRLLGCPFYKFDPFRYQHCLARCNLRRIQDVKQHLQRKHGMDGLSICEVCFTAFSEEAQLDAHRQCGCKASASPGPEELSEYEFGLLRGMKSGMAENEQWMVIWDTFFRGHPRPDSIYVFEPFVEAFLYLRYDLRFVEKRKSNALELNDEFWLSLRTPPPRSLFRLLPPSGETPDLEAANRSVMVPEALPVRPLSGRAAVEPAAPRRVQAGANRRLLPRPGQTAGQQGHGAYDIDFSPGVMADRRPGLHLGTPANPNQSPRPLASSTAYGSAAAELAILCQFPEAEMQTESNGFFGTAPVQNGGFNNFFFDSYGADTDMSDAGGLYDDNFIEVESNPQTPRMHDGGSRRRG